jgi:hypothetical protein
MELLTDVRDRLLQVADVNRILCTFIKRRTRSFTELEYPRSVLVAFRLQTGDSQHPPAHCCCKVGNRENRPQLSVPG